MMPACRRLHLSTVAAAAVSVAGLVGCGGGSSAASFPPLRISAPTITVQPATQSVLAPAVATFTVVAAGSAPLSYQWSVGDGPINGATSSTYTTPPTNADSDGETFTVSVSNAAGTVVSAPASLRVNLAPTITSPPQNETVAAPVAATFAVAASGTLPLSYQWAENGQAIAGATAASFTTPGTSTSDNGASFTVTVTNAFGSSTSTSAILTVTSAEPANPASTGPILIGGDPRSQSVVVGTGATFVVSAIGTQPISYQWNQNGVAIAGANSSTYTTPTTSVSDNGEAFTVTVSNSINSLTSPPATLTVTSEMAAPQVSAAPQNTQVGQGDTARFQVFATGTAPLSYQWFKNGLAIPGARDDSYTIPEATTADNNAQFTVQVTNAAGNAMSPPGSLFVSAPVVGLSGFRLLGPGYPLPFAPSDIIGVQWNFQVVTNEVADGDILFGFNYLTAPGSTANGYDIESNLYSSSLAFANGGCTTFPPLGTSTPAEASLRNATADYPYHAGVTAAVGSAIDSSDTVNWPVQTYLVDNTPNLWKSDSISQFNLNGLQGTVSIVRGGTTTDVSAFQRCGLAMLPVTYRVWTVTTQISGRSTEVNQIVVPDADAQFLVPAQALQFASEFLAQPGTFTVQLWGFQFQRESSAAWTPASEFMTNPIYDGDGNAFGVQVITVGGHDRVEFSNIPGGTYLPANLPFVLLP